MDWVLTQDELPKGPAVGVAISLSDPDDLQFHVGLICSDEVDATILELCWHHTLRNDGLDNRDRHFVWARIDLPRPRVNAILGHARRVFELHPKVKYGLIYQGERFQEERPGLLSLSGNRVGLTCATFILAVLQTAGLELLDLTSWPVRSAADDRWRQKIIGCLNYHAFLGKFEVSAEHVQNVANEPMAPRFRPEEVAGACPRASNTPVAFSEVESAASALVTGFVAAEVLASIRF